MHIEKNYSVLQVVPMYGGDYSDRIWEEEENRSTHCCRKLNRQGTITLNEEVEFNLDLLECPTDEIIVHN